jgi:hypothetical protein
MIHVGGTRCVTLCNFVQLCATFSTDNYMNTQARITLGVDFMGVECIRPD